MKNSTITNTLNKCNEESKEYSLGFRRLTALPIRVRRNLDLHYNLKFKFDSNKAMKKEKEFLQKLTEQEFITFLRLA